VADTTPQPLDLLTLFDTGATVKGVPARKVWAELIDGRVQRFELRTETATETDDAESDLTPMQSAVSEVVRAMKPGEVMTMEEIAKKAGYTANGKLRDFVRLIAPGAGLRSTNRGLVKS
jgi:O6-methylguanine-DNA--protein-cysteine methyltransferase